MCLDVHRPVRIDTESQSVTSFTGHFCFGEPIAFIKAEPNVGSYFKRERAL